MGRCMKYPGVEPGSWVWYPRHLCSNPECEYHFPTATDTGDQEDSA